MNRARLTIVDVLYIAFALASLAALYPVYSEVYASTAPMLDTGPELLFGTLFPIAIVVLLSLIYVEARGGLRR